ncbi:carbohydrate-binding protein [Cohnella endophytica]|uniref:Carbohydrate-binding protein n=1 Tax=Cohnella endophytica TaxID=2419778 RepID=A0A494XHI0_9BACL|nr:glycosyl hydrolase family 28-related protein [Cohnella endophytica]RKP49988.1 carbohydrate-binding protein [Cohnella endophytica]
MIRKLSRLIVAVLLFTSISTLAPIPGRSASAADAPPKWQLVQTKYETADTFVAAYSVKDFGATGDGVTDVTAVFQELLDSLGRLGGGTLFVPEGKYVIKGTLEIPKGVTLRGEWSKPVRGQPIQGTILMAYSGRGDEEATPFIRMVTSGAVRDLSIWYPEQLPDSITPYPPAIEFGKPNYFGNEFNNAKNVTFVNAYSGLVFSRKNGGTGPTLNGIYGTPLSRGVEIDNIVDVGRIEWIDFSPDYWSGSGLPNAPAKGSAFEQWIRDNGTGIVMRRNDWSYTGYITVDGYNKGFHLAPSITSEGAAPNGHNYELTFTRNRTAIDFEVAADVGVMFTNVHIRDGETGISVGPSANGVIQLSGIDVDADTALQVNAASKAKVLLRQSKIERGEVAISGGTFMPSDSDFDNAAPQIRLLDNARGIVTGNRFKEKADIENASKFLTTIDHEPVGMAKLPTFPTIAAETHKPARMALYVVTDAPFGAKNDGTTDNTSAIQKALDRAASDGGGVVFLPPGKYKVAGHLTVPTGVELKGSVDNSTVPTGPGSILEAYADRGNPNGEPFVKLSEGSGLRGITFNYPEQLATQLPNVAAYPYAIRATGKDVYIVNVGLRAVYSGIDLYTNKTDGHFVDFVTGHVFKTGIRVGGGTEGGLISNLQFNQLVYAAGRESKFGTWPNSPAGDSKAVYDYGFNNLAFMILGDVKDETLYNNFHYGSAKGLVLTAENGRGPTGVSVGLGVDGSRKSILLEATGEEGFDFVDTQIVSIGGGEDTRYVEASPAFAGEVRLFGADFWGNPGTGILLDGGTVSLQLANFANPGEYGFAKLTNASRLRLDSSVVSSARSLLNVGGESRLFARSSIIDAGSAYLKKMGEWRNNQSNLAFAKPPGGETVSPSPGPSAAQASPPPSTIVADPAVSSHGNSDRALWLVAGGIVLLLAAGALAVYVYRRKSRSTPSS